MTSWVARALAAAEDERAVMFDLLSGLVRAPSVTGSDAEHDALAVVAEWVGREGLDVDHWQPAAWNSLRRAAWLRTHGRQQSPEPVRRAGGG